MSEQIIDPDMFLWNSFTEEEPSTTVNFLIPQCYFVPSPPTTVPGVLYQNFEVAESPRVVFTDYLVQIPPFLEANSLEPIESGPEESTSLVSGETNCIITPALNYSNTTTDEVPNNNRSTRGRGRRNSQRTFMDEEARVARRRERNRLAARRSRTRFRAYYNQLERHVDELETEVTRLRALLAGREENQ
ncbi:17899_t:CDS:1 [Funneliformis geosporum]|uniref:10889_t:CDS:1 n=1 Tax=Funneliformis geosporum TaxID=1117311 RepID=A0A9W4SMD7_9GLOM|nr:10889_t:CDS:1 [Funneliformis geosporum]CAI2177249.1 17899_t:CDS:1 [Funneliformis geosporum]